MKTKKKYVTRRIKKMSSKNKKGGILMSNMETDLVNTHVCNSKLDAKKDSPGLEILTSISTSFQLNEETLGYLYQTYQSVHDKWFKFIIINNDQVNYIYIIDGAKINKHSVCMIQGLLDVTKDTDEYNELRAAYNNLLIFKNENGSNMEFMSDELKNECMTLIESIDKLIDRDIKCMPVMAAGSGSVNSDKSICINNKSGHYKPTEDSMLLARDAFEHNTNGAHVFIKEKEDKQVLKDRYGKNAENYSGICI
jgi:hypothetical protein